MNGLFQADIEDRGILLDPRTKLFVLLTIVIFVLGGMGTLAPQWLNALISVTPLLFLCSAKQWGKALGYGAVYAAADLFLIYRLDSVHGTGRYLLIMLCRGERADNHIRQGRVGSRQPSHPGRQRLRMHHGGPQEGRHGG